MNRNNFRIMGETNSFFGPFQKKWEIPIEGLIRNSLSKLSLIEKYFLGLFVVIFIFSGFSILWQVNKAYLVEVPAKGGSFGEGVIGTPRAINPLLASESSDADKDLTILIYSGLLKATPQGELIPDLAQNFNISENGLVYDFILKDNVYFHDGTPVRAEDVEFTIKKAQDPLTKSPRQINWEGVLIEVVNDREIKFILSEPYSPFLENTTLGILPKHLWNNLDPDQFAGSLLNLEPIGSGPYKIDDIKRGSNGLPIYYQLKAFNKYSLGEPNITNIYIKFFFNEEELISAFENNQIESLNSIAPEEALAFQNKSILETASLSRIFGVFFNQNQASVFSNKEVRKALEMALDKNRLVEEVLAGYGEALYSPLPPKYSSITDEINSKNESGEEKLQKARVILEKGGWEFNETEKIWEKETKDNKWTLSFSISTSDSADLKASAQIIKENWEKLGAKVEIKIFDLSDLKQNVIRPRKFDALLFGTILGRDLDLFPFWHSSQRTDPGLNITSYVDIATDGILEDIRLEVGQDVRAKKYQEFEKVITEYVPVVFTYSPNFIYLVPERIKNISLDFLTAPSERFLNINEWYVETNNVWKIFN